MLPVFEPNQLNLFQLNKEATATWNFTKDNDAPTINYQKTAGILVTQLEIKADETEDSSAGEFRCLNKQKEMFE